MINVTATTPNPTPMPFIKDSLEIHIETSSEIQLFRIPFTDDLLIVTTEVSLTSSTSNLTSQVFFGAGGLQTTSLSYQQNYAGMHLLPAKDYFYASPSKEDYFLMVMPNTPSTTVTIRPQPLQHLCNPVLLCNGHGSCNDRRLTDKCQCIEGFGYGYTDFHCETKKTAYSWLATACSFAAIVGFVILKVVVHVSTVRRNKVCYTTLDYAMRGLQKKL
jgi:hypothetical protein